MAGSVWLAEMAPAGVLSEVIEAEYPTIMMEPSVVDLAASVERAIRWAGLQPARAAPREPVPRDRYDVEYSYFGSELVQEAGARSRCEIALQNTGLWPWAPFAESGPTICHRWLNEDGKILDVAGGGLPFEGRVEPGDLVAAVIEFTAPPMPGRYRLEVDLVEEGVCWFSERYAAPLQIPVDVRKPQRPWQELSKYLRPRSDPK